MHPAHAQLTVGVYTPPMNRCGEDTRAAMDRSRDKYQAYTLRLSRVGETQVWRATVYCAITGQRWRFATVEQLGAFLRQAVEARAGPEPAEERTEG